MLARGRPEIIARRTVAAVLLALVPSSAGPSGHELERLWLRFQAAYRRAHPSEEVRRHRFAAFRANVMMAAELNARQGIECSDLFDGRGCVFGVTKYSDEWPEELRQALLPRRPSLAGPRSRVPVLGAPPPDSPGEKVVDWRSRGAVTAVNFQDKCGSCWAFSIAQQMESAFFLSTGRLRRLSQQQIVSCDEGCVDGVGDCGCGGGDVVSGCEYVRSAGGLPAAESYPDTSSPSGVSGNCTPGIAPAVGLRSYGFAVAPCNHSRDPRDERPCDAQDELGLARVVALRGPVSVSLTWGPGWWMYKGGVYDLPCSNLVADIDHAMQIVGYDMSGDKPYWIVRNTFGADWGIGGYIHLAMGKNTCGIANEAVLMEVAPAGPETMEVVV